MRIAIASEGNIVSGHFGHCEGFTMFDVLENKIQNKEFVASPGHKPGVLPVFLKEKGADVIIAGGMGRGAQDLFAENNIKVVVGIEGECDKVIKEYIEGKIISTGSICEKHEHEGHCED